MESQGLCFLCGVKQNHAKLLHRVIVVVGAGQYDEQDDEDDGLDHAPGHFLDQQDSTDDDCQQQEIITQVVHSPVSV